MPNLHQSMSEIRDLAAKDGIPAHHYGRRLDQIRELANAAMIDTDGLEDRDGSTWGDRLRNDPVIQQRADQTRNMLRGVAKRLKATR